MWSGRKFSLIPLCTIFAYLVENATAQLVQSSQRSSYMGEFAALPWSLAWLNPSYTGFYGGLGNVGQLQPDSAYFGGAGAQVVPGGGGYNFAMGAYNSAPSRHSTHFCLIATFTLYITSLFTLIF
ncbi:hypothetical protein RvY_10789 [Ramazzottius varieornatus]|uniref:Uncharacterized protein n=1 Tax=Ramazzottius varieornatus TaxID=947166 RepID=A0A1D1VDX9_RAMVA|nr:hypothetical protein RvY_10789 [Ramazzottius varieornatus]